VDVEWLILADAAQVLGNKLYLLGGGWDTLVINAIPANQVVAIAASFCVPWTETNQPHPVEIEIINEDRQSDPPLLRFGAQVEVGRPIGIAPGSDQRTQIAVTSVLTFRDLGNYAVIVRVEGEEGKKLPFRLIRGPLFSTGPVGIP
jgi:hypothetical protein